MMTALPGRRKWHVGGLRSERWEPVCGSFGVPPEPWDVEDEFFAWPPDHPQGRLLCRRCLTIIRPALIDGSEGA